MLDASLSSSSLANSPDDDLENAPLPSLFGLGRVVVTPAALLALLDVEEEPGQMLRRHKRGDWGQVSAQMQEENARALEAGGRLQSEYPLPDSPDTLRIVTDLEAGVTTLLLAPALAPVSEPQKGCLAPRFPFGQVVSTPGAIAKLLETGADAFALLERHGKGDWGEMSAEDKAANDAALVEGGRLFSSYNLPNDSGKVWVITEWDRSATTLLLPEEY